MTTDSAHRLLVTGASGYLANRLLPLAAERVEAIGVSRGRPPGQVLWMPCDLMDRNALGSLMHEVEPTAVINAAAANPGSGENYEVNVAGAANVATVSAEVGARLVHVSSDIVHGGDAAPYGDEAGPTPINDYGRSKADGETAVLAACPAALVVRTSLIYGLDEIDRGTAGFAAKLEAGEELSLWDDAMRQPVWIDAFSDGLLKLALDHPTESGLINLAGEQTVSRAGFGRRLLEFWGVETAGLVLGSAADVPGQPLDLALSFDRARLLGLDLRGVDEVLNAHR